MAKNTLFLSRETSLSASPVDYLLRLSVVYKRKPATLDKREVNVRVYYCSW